MSARLGVQSAWACLMRRREWFPLAQWLMCLK